MNLQELQGIKRLQQAERGVDNKRDHWFNALIDAGWRNLGSGMYADVWANPRYDYVLKVFSAGDRAYLKWVQISQANASNPHFPRFVSPRPVRISPTYLAVRMERLSPLSNSQALVIVRDTDRVMTKIEHTEYTFGEAIARPVLAEKLPTLVAYCQRNPDYVAAMDAVKSALGSDTYSDTHNGNFMMRGDTIVIMDPLGVF